MSNVTHPLPNPFTPLAFLPPTVALQLETARYLHVGTFGAFVWDWLMSMSEEYEMLRKSTWNRSFPLIAYFVVRFGTLGFLITGTLFETAVVHNCTSLENAISVFYILATTGACFLFYLRVRAIFYDNFIVKAFFGFLWLSVLGASVTVPFAIGGTHIGPTQYCINSHFSSFGTASIITITVNDTLVLFAISYKLAWDNNRAATPREVAMSFLNGQGLNAVSKVLYRGGLMYYLSTVSMNIVTMTMNLTPSVPPVYRSMVTIPNAALQNVMASRVFRKLKLGLIVERESVASSTQQSMPLAWMPARHQHTMENSAGSGTLVAKPRQSLNDDGYSSNIMNIKVDKGDVESSMDSDRSKYR